MSVAETTKRSGISNGGHDIRSLIAELEREVDGEVRFDDGSRAAYSTDASNYRQVPIGVVIPHSIDAAVETIRVCRDHRVPVLNRGGGTSLAGECTNVAVVIDWTKYCDAIESVDLDARTAIVQPGLVLDALNTALAPQNLMWGPRPATHSHCTFGGMLGNNSCGSTAQKYGKSADNITRLEILTYDGIRGWVGPTSDEEYARITARDDGLARLYTGMKAIADEYGDEIREGYPHIPRRVSGYNLDSLLPENGFDVAKALVGSESTLVTILRAELTLVPTVPTKTLVVFGFPSIFDAADAAPAAVDSDPLAIEGLDRTLIEHERAKRMDPGALDLLPAGDGWLIVEMPGENLDEANRRAKDLIESFENRDPKPEAKTFDDADEKRRIMDVREAALGAAAWIPGHGDAWPGWEDAAVPPDRLGAYLRDFARLIEEFEYANVAIYGHFGQGCVHCRVPFDLTSTAGIETYSRFVHRAAELVVSYGGSLSGEHGDGQARGPLLPIMFGDRLVGAMRRLKRLFDPLDRMNPNKVIDGHAETQDLRLGVDYRPEVSGRIHFTFDAEGGFDKAALRCVGIGNCRSHTGNVMCPSYRATGEEEHSTRGRSRLLFEMVNGNRPDSVITDGWRSEEVKDALDLCLSCKGCRSDCPVDVDMATYKAEFLSHHYAGRIRPMSHYTMGWLPLWARIANLAPGLVNAVSHAPGIGTLIKRLGGIQPERPLPSFQPRFTDAFRRRPPRTAPAPHGNVVLWPDTFTNSFHPQVAAAAVAVLEDAGYRVIVPQEALCCGLTWISTGQLSAAERILVRTGEILSPLLADGTPMVVLEPSCAAVFRSDARELLPQDTNLELVADRTRTLAELLKETEGWRPPRIDRHAVLQPHCHQHAILHSQADHEILDEAGIDANTLEGCCGLAGNFGFENGHLDVSVAVADHAFLPAVAEAAEEDIVLADGFSCRTQLDQLGDGRRAVHLAELLAGGLRGASLGARPERVLARGRGPRLAIASAVIERARAALPGRKS